MPHPLFEDLRRSVDDALAAQDVAAALEAVRPVARAVAAEEGAVFRELIGRVPDEAWHDDATIASAMAASYRAAGSPRGSSAIGYLHAADAALAAADRSRDPERVAVWLAQAAALRTLGRLDAANEYIAKTRALDGPGGVLSVPVRVELGARSTLEQGMVDLHLGNVDAARGQLEFAHGLAAEHLTRAEHIECLGGLALVAYIQAEFERSTTYADDARAISTGTTLWESGYAAGALAALALVAIDRHDLATAAALEPELTEAASRTEFEPFAYVIGGYLRLADGRFAESLDFLQRARQGYRNWAPSGLGGGVEQLLRATVFVILDQGDESWEILRDLPSFEHHVLCPARVTALLRLRHGDLQGAANALKACEELGDEHSPSTMIEVRMLRAAIEFERGDFTIADAMIDRALATMARIGSRSALRVVPPGTLAALTTRALTRRHSPEVARILDGISATTGGSSRLIEPLSQRELLVLAEVEKGSTVGGIASALYISPNTVKTHLRRLYRKLGVATRSDAIRKAKSLGLGRTITPESPVPQIADMSPE